MVDICRIPFNQGFIFHNLRPNIFPLEIYFLVRPIEANKQVNKSEIYHYESCKAVLQTPAENLINLSILKMTILQLW